MLHTQYTDVRACSAAQGGKEASKAKAQKAAKQVKKSTWKKQRKPRFSVVFHRPKTLKHQRDPKYPRIRYGPACSSKSALVKRAPLMLQDPLAADTHGSVIEGVKCPPYSPACALL